MNRKQSEQLMKRTNKETEGMDFTYIADVIAGKELTEEQKRTREAVKRVFQEKKAKG